MTDQPRTDITASEVQDALNYLQMTNPKPEVPIDTTIVGHLIVATARKLRELEQRTTPTMAHYNSDPDAFRGEPW